MTVHLRTLGEIDLRSSDGTELRHVLVQPKRFALLAYLAVATPRTFHSRDTLLALLWPEHDAEHARASLRQVLYTLRQELGSEVMLTRGDEVAVNGAALRVDVREFECLLSAGERERALELYGGPFLAGYFVSGAPGFEQWVEEERATLARSRMSALEVLAEACAGADPVMAAGYWRELASQAPYSSRIAYRLMLALEAAGERAAAVQHAQVHASLLWEKLEAEPDPEVTALADRLRHHPAASHWIEPPVAAASSGSISMAGGPRG